MAETKTRSYDVNVSYTGKFVFPKEAFEEIRKYAAEFLGKIALKEAKGPLSTDDRYKSAEAARYQALSDDELVGALLKEAFKQLMADHRKELKGEGFTKLSPPQVVVTPITPKVSRKCELHDDRTACTKLCARFLESN